MDDRPGIVVAGASGRMGRMLLRAVLDAPQARLAGALVRPGSDWVGRDVGEAMGGAAVGVTASDDPVATIAPAQAVIDFTTPDTTAALSELTAQARAVHVVGTTGLGAGHLARLRAAARHAPIIRAGNMSLGVNLLVGLTRRVAAALGEEWDIELVEAHHGRKLDAPSGTALMLGEAAAEGRGAALEDLRLPPRDGFTGPRPPGGIGFSAIRGGDIVGEHDVIFAGQGERIVLRHVATDRAIFARGALRAALWGQDKGPGEYDMSDVLGL